MSWTESFSKPNYCCVPELLKFYRERLGWTQQTLSEKAGYSLRVINKAESGRSISRHTIADLAEALSADDVKVYPEDLINDPVVFARKYIDSFYRQQKTAISEIESFLCDETIFTVQGNPEEIPFAGEFRGVAGVSEMIEKFYSVLEVPDGYDHSDQYQYISSGNEVVIWGESWIHPIGYPLKEPVVISIRMTFQKGKLIRFDDRYDVKSAAEGIARLRRSEKS